VGTGGTRIGFIHAIGIDGYRSVQLPDPGGIPGRCVIPTAGSAGAGDGLGVVVQAVLSAVDCPDWNVDAGVELGTRDRFTDVTELRGMPHRVGRRTPGSHPPERPRRTFPENPLTGTGRNGIRFDPSFGTE